MRCLIHKWRPWSEPRAEVFELYGRREQKVIGQETVHLQRRTCERCNKTVERTVEASCV